MGDPQVAKWMQRGEVYLWHYKECTRNYPGWNLTADDQACDSLLRLCDLMRSARWSSSATLTVSRPTPGILSVPDNRGGAARWYAPKLLRLE